MGTDYKVRCKLQLPYDLGHDNSSSYKVNPTKGHPLITADIIFTEIVKYYKIVPL